MHYFPYRLYVCDNNWVLNKNLFLLKLLYTHKHLKKWAVDSRDFSKFNGNENLYRLLLNGVWCSRASILDKRTRSNENI